MQYWSRERRGESRRIEMETTLSLFHGPFSSVFRPIHSTLPSRLGQPLSFFSRSFTGVNNDQRASFESTLMVRAPGCEVWGSRFTRSNEDSQDERKEKIIFLSLP